MPVDLQALYPKLIHLMLDTVFVVDRDNEMARCRKQLDWDGQIALALDPERARAMRESSRPEDSEVCTMCGEFCAIKVTRKAATS